MKTNHITESREDLNKIPQAPTPSPWGWESLPNGNRIALSGDREDVLIATEVDEIGPFVMISDANAALIQSAPDLLSALKQINEFFRHNNPVYPSALAAADLTTDPDVTFKALIAACIAKAEGRS